MDRGKREAIISYENNTKQKGNQFVRKKKRIYMDLGLCEIEAKVLNNCAASIVEHQKCQVFQT